MGSATLKKKKKISVLVMFWGETARRIATVTFLNIRVHGLLEPAEVDVDIQKVS